jgi:hypothetical protein
LSVPWCAIIACTASTSGVLAFGPSPIGRPLEISTPAISSSIGREFR